MKKLLLSFSILTLLSLTAKSQTTVIKQEVDTAVISKIYACYSVNQLDGQVVAAKNFKEKKDFVNDMIIAFIKRLSKDCAGG